MGVPPSPNRDSSLLSPHYHRIHSSREFSRPRGLASSCTLLLRWRPIASWYRWQYNMESTPVDSTVLTLRRTITLLVSILVALCCGTNYVSNFISPVIDPRRS